MRVTFGSSFRNALIDVNRAAEQFAQRQREVSSGKRLHAASENPSAMSTVVLERTEMQQLDQYLRAADSVESRLMVADAVFTDLVKQLTAAQARGVGGRSTVLTQPQRNALAGDLRGIRDALLAAVNTSYRDVQIFSGTASQTPPYAPGPPISAYQGNADVAYVDVGRQRSAQVTFDASSFLGGTPSGDIFQVLDDLAMAVQTGDMGTIDARLQAVGQVFQQVTQAQSGVGTDLAALVDDRARLGEMRRASDKRRSALEDTNLAESLSGQTQADAAHRAGLSALAAASRLSLLDYLK